MNKKTLFKALKQKNCGLIHSIVVLFPVVPAHPTPILKISVGELVNSAFS